MLIVLCHLMQTHNSSTTNVERRLQRATQYVQKQWLPVNKPLLTRIRRGLREGVYELDTAFLLEELRLDQGLLLSVIRATCIVLKDEVLEQADGMDPMALLEFAGYQRLKAILEDDFFFSSAHDLQCMSEEQRQRMKESLVSVGAVQTLSKKLKEHANLGYSTALLRQLGLNLISWNYPTIFREALEMRDRSLEDALIELLGFSPQMLAFRIIHNWNMSTAVKRLVVSGGEVSARDGIEEEVLHLCEVGETLAQACNPSSHQIDRASWNSAKEVILDILGEAGIREIQNQVTENARLYLESFGRDFQDLKKLNPDAAGASVFKGFISDKDPGELREKTFEHAVLQDVYRLIEQKEEKRALAALVQLAIPKFGFTGGAIYILDPLSKKLIRRVRIGDCVSSQPEVISIENTSVEDSAILAGFHCSTPILENVLDPEEGYMTFVSAVLGKNRRAGVLYLEKKDFSASSSDQILISFKAVQQSFCDCLKLR